MKLRNLQKKFFTAATLMLVLALGVCYTVNAAGGISSTNIHRGNYTLWSSPVYSNLYTDNGALVRVEYANSKVAVEKYDTDGNYLSTITEFDAPHSIWGGFYKGEKYFYLVFGEPNSGDDDTLNVVFVRQYGKGWSFIRETAVKAIDTRSPFEAGSLRMAEAGGMLYVFTCHVMYSGHQANMTLMFDRDTLKYAGRSTKPYSSHSFNQFIQTDGSYMYTLDHGDAYPRALMMGKYKAGTASYSTSTKELYKIAGPTGENETGVSVGGFLLSGDKFYIVGNSIVQDESTYNTDTKRNIFLMTTDKNMSAPTFAWLTNYTSDSGISPQTPYITRLDDGSLIIMWEESASSKYTTKIVKTDASGNIIKTSESHIALSGCQPMLLNDKLYWYVTNQSSPIFYTLDTATLETPKPPEESWTIDANGTLTVSGKGFLPETTVPWESRKAEIKHVIIGDDIYSLPQNAFNGCTALEDADLGNGISSIGFGTFYGCTALKSIKMPDTLNSLGGSAFYNCSSLTEIVVPDGVKTIGSNTFFGCRLDSLILPNTLEILDSMSLYGCGISSLTLPPSLKTINYAAFWSCSRLKTLTVPNGVKNIGQQAFAYSSIKHLALPQSVTSINSNAFSSCSASLYCIKGSYADNFLSSAGKSYAYIGDIDNSGGTDNADIKKILHNADGSSDPSSDPSLLLRLDTNLDGKIDIFDAVTAFGLEK